MAELDLEVIEQLKLRLIAARGHGLVDGVVISFDGMEDIIAALEDGKRLQKRYDEQTADCSRLSQRYEELLDKLEKYGYMEGIEAVLEDRHRLRDALITYGDHIQPLCPALSGGLCDCGWTLEAAALIPEGRND